MSTGRLDELVVLEKDLVLGVPVVEAEVPDALEREVNLPEFGGF
jgi:hypothetical protein